MEYTLEEKLAIVKVIDSVILADDVVHKGEINALGQLMKLLDFDSNFIVSARIVDTEQGMKILKGMTSVKKQALATILEDVANADGFVHEKEAALLTTIFTAMGIVKNIHTGK